MQIKPLTDDLAVSEQIAPEDIPAIKAAGYRAILCNRPDAEGAGQPEFDAIARAARAEGLEVHHQPVISGMMSGQDVSDFAAALASLPAPVLAYCRSGTRCTMLWAASQVGQRPADEIRAAAGAAGYDVSGIVGR